MIGPEENKSDLTGQIAAINAALAGASDVIGPVKVAIVPIEQLDHLEENARFFRNETFKNLIENIKRDGALTSVPYCWLNRETGRYLILSGNHRVKAAREAGQRYVLILFNDSDLSEQERIAIQLSHNAITGEDDPVILKGLWEKLADVDLKYYAGLDDKALKALSEVKIAPIAEVRLDFRTVAFIFLPEEVERVAAAFKAAMEMVATKDIYLARFADFDRLMEAQAKAQAAYNVKNAATSLTVLLDVFEKHLDDLQEGWRERDDEEKVAWVPLASIFGTDCVPVGAGKIILKAAQRMMDSGEVKKKNLWQALELWAADYLAGRSFEEKFGKGNVA